MFANLLRPLLLCKPFFANHSGEPAGLGYGGVCSKAASSDFVQGKRASGIAVSSAGSRRGDGVEALVDCADRQAYPFTARAA
jgi:hypothetical protein